MRVAPDRSGQYHLYKTKIGDAIYLRSLFNDYLAGRTGQTDENDRTSEYALLDRWDKSYYKSKFVVLAAKKALMGGNVISILFLDKPDRVFNAWVYPMAGAIPDLRGLDSAGLTEVEMVRVREAVLKDEAQGSQAQTLQDQVVTEKQQETSKMAGETDLPDVDAGPSNDSSRLGVGGGLYHVGGGVTAPVPLNNVEAEFTEEARQAKLQGTCMISLIVNAEGNPQDPRVVRGLGKGLDEKALEAVRKYKFRPAMKDGNMPVPVMITVEVTFRLY